MKLLSIVASGVLCTLSAEPSLARVQSDAASPQSPAAMSGPDYVRSAADWDNFEVQSGRLAASRSKRADVKGFARQMVADHTESAKSLTAALVNQDRKITPPSTRLSAANQAKLDLLRKAPKATFDQMYLQQQLEAHQAALDLHQRYAEAGTDATLKQVAVTIAPVVQRHLSAIQGLMGSM